MKRPRVPSLLQKQLYQEVHSKCPFCEHTEVAALEIHHIDGDPTNNEFGNLLVVCGNCHNKITAGLISEQQVRTKKSILEGVHSKTPKPLQSVEGIHIGTSRFTPRRLNPGDMRMR